MYFLLEKRKMSTEKLLKDLVESLTEEDAAILFESVEMMNGLEPPIDLDDLNEKWYDDKWDKESTKF